MKRYDLVPGLLGAAAGAILAASPAMAADSFMDVGKQAPITILINASPWYNGFESVVNLYEEQTAPLIEFYAAVARKDLTGSSGPDWHMEETLSRAEALKLFTASAAYARFAEKDLGTITPGKRADLTAFYDRGGVPLTGDARAAVAAALGLPAPTVDPSTLHE